MNENILISQGMSYEYLKRLEEHSKLYDYVPDKKSFLRSIIPYEQKLVLLNSKDPYEVLSYLDELDIRATRTILNQLTYDEIKKVISLFSSEDKKEFYAHYSDLDLVNQFIVYDKNASEYIDDLTFNRKVEIIDSSNSKTVEATSKVYETMTEEEQEKTSDLVTDASAVSVLSTVESNDDNTNVEEEVDESNLENNVVEEVIEEVVNQVEENKEENQENKDEEIKEEEIKEEKTEENQEKPIDPESMQKEPEEVTLEGKNNNLELFEQAKQNSEIAVINEIKNKVIANQINEPIITNNENQKTL